MQGGSQSPVSPPKATQTPEEDSHNQPAAKKMQSDDCGDKATSSTVRKYSRTKDELNSIYSSR